MIASEASIEDIESFLAIKFKNHLKRLQHIYRVKYVAISLGNIYNADISKIIVAAYLHDVTKIDSLEEDASTKDKSIDSKVPAACLHAFTASEFAKNKFNINDADILNAIKYHCTGRKNMSLLEKIIYVSDYVEEGREFDNTGLRELAKINIDKAVYLIMKKTKDYLLSKNKEFSSLTEEAILDYKKKLEDFND